MTATPKSPGTPESSGTPSPAGAPQAGDTGRIPALLVDDEAELRLMLSAVLRSRGYDCDVHESAESVLAAVDQADAVRPRLVICDAGLPEMDGLELLRRLEHHFPGLGKHAVIVSGHDPGPRLAKLHDDIGVRSLPKPFRMEELLDLCAEITAPPPAGPDAPDTPSVRDTIGASEHEIGDSAQDVADSAQVVGDSQQDVGSTNLDIGPSAFDI